jgi:diacylglycerol kinase family enzyme
MSSNSNKKVTLLSNKLNLSPIHQRKPNSLKPLVSPESSSIATPLSSSSVYNNKRKSPSFSEESSTILKSPTPELELKESLPTQIKNESNDSFNDKNIDKLIVLINSKSGGQKGKILGKEFAKYNSILFDMFALNSNKDNALNKLGNALYKYKNKSIVVICGGDGSISWGTVLIDKALKILKKNNKIISFPTFLPLPIGTGNDLSRSVGWGNFEPNRKFLLDTISDIYFCTKITKRFCDIDRWSVKYKSKGDYSKLPNKFLCYLSIGYDAKVAYNWEEERRNNREKFNSQFKNQLMYVKHGATELFKPSTPINDDIEVIIDNEIILLPEFCRSFKLININSAMNGLFLWGHGKSSSTELQDWKYPSLNDGKIECMGTKGLRDMLMYKINLNHAHRIRQADKVIIRIKPKNNKTIYLQTDGEAFPIKHELEIEVKLHDKLPVVIGYQNPRGVPQWLNACLDDINIYRTRMALRKRFRNKYLPKNDEKKTNNDININHNNNKKAMTSSNSSLLDWVWQTQSPSNSPDNEIKNNKNNDSKNNDANDDELSPSITKADDVTLKPSASTSMFNSFWNLFQQPSNENSINKGDIEINFDKENEINEKE